VQDFHTGLAAFLVPKQQCQTTDGITVTIFITNKSEQTISVKDLAMT